MRTAIGALWIGAALWAGAGASFAEEPAGEKPEAPPAAPAKREVKDGRLTDPYWGLVLTAEGLTETAGSGNDAQVFAGECPGGVKVEILVAEGAEELTAGEWSRNLRATWKKKGRSMTGVEEAAGPVPTLLFVEEGLGGAPLHHGYAFHARGLTCFMLHCTEEVAPGSSGAAVRARLGGLALGKDTGASLEAFGMGKREGRPPADPGIRLRAGQAYTNQNTGNPPMAIQVLTRLSEEIREGDLDINGTWTLYETLGTACLLSKKPLEAVDWLKKAEAISKRCSNPAALDGQSTYNLACAYSLAGETDDAFDTLLRCAGKTGWMMTYWPLAQKDPDLESLRSDPRWEHLRKAGR